MRNVFLNKVKSIDDALRISEESKGDKQFIAGGTDVIVKLREEEDIPGNEITLIDVYDIPELKEIKEEADTLIIGAAVSHREIEDSEILQKHAPLLLAACRDIGGPQIRNRGTLGGNIVNASPAADSVPALIVLNATLRLIGPSGEERVSIEEFFVGPYKTRIKEDQILVSIEIEKLKPDTKSNYLKIGRRKALSISRMNVAVAIHKDEQGKVDDMRFAAGSVMPKPRRITEVESIFMGKKPTEEMLLEAKETIGDVMVKESGVRKSTVYKKPVIGDVTYSSIKKII